MERCSGSHCRSDQDTDRQHSARDSNFQRCRTPQTCLWSDSYRSFSQIPCTSLVDLIPQCSVRFRSTSRLTSCRCSPSLSPHLEYCKRVRPVYCLWQVLDRWQSFQYCPLEPRGVARRVCGNKSQARATLRRALPVANHRAMGHFHRRRLAPFANPAPTYQTERAERSLRQPIPLWV